MQARNNRPVIGWTRNGRPVWPIAGGSDDPAPDPEPAPEPPANPDPEPAKDPEPEPSDPEPADPQDPDPDDKPLGEAGEKALQEWKARAKAAEKQAKQLDKLQSELDQLRAEKREAEKAQMDEHERKLLEAREEAAMEARDAVMSEVRGERLSTLVRAHATGKLADPEDALRFIDLDELDPDDVNGIGEAIELLVVEKPYLAPARPAPKAGAQGATRQLDKSAPDPESMSVEDYKAWRGIGLKARESAAS